MAEWVVPEDGKRVLEPSMGEGVFVQAVDDVCADRGHTSVELWGIEYDRQAFESVVDAGLVEPDRAIHSDFLKVEPFPVDAVIGNPPYVRLRHLPPVEAKSAAEAAAAVLGHSMDPSGSVWMPFVLHAAQFLRNDGRLALVLPYDFTYVRYARPLWRFLSRHFAALRVVRVRERIFPAILQEVVLLFAEGFGGTTTHVKFEAYETRATFQAGRQPHQAWISIDAVEDGDRPFMEALLPSALQELLHSRLHQETIEVGKLAKFNIGYVTGHKEFFHPGPGEIRSHGLSVATLKPTVTSARQLRGVGIFTSGLPIPNRKWLFLPPSGPLGEPEAAYVTEGTNQRVHKRYKCRVRKPWWIVPGVATPDVLLSVFSEEPVMLLNDSRLKASNSLLCGYLRPNVDSRKLVASWYTPLTRLHRELQVHSLGGGVFVLVPNEVARVRVPRVSARFTIAALDRAVQKSDMGAAYSWGRETVLRRMMRLTSNELDLIDEGHETLARWRKSASR